MKIQPLAYNHIQIRLDNGETLDINDGTKIHKGNVTIKLLDPTKRQIASSYSTQYDATVRVEFYGEEET